MKPWNEVVANEEFRSLNEAEREEARQQYFNEVIAPQVPEGETAAVWGEFDLDTRDSLALTELPEEVPQEEPQYGLSALATGGATAGGQPKTETSMALGGADVDAPPQTTEEMLEKTTTIPKAFGGAAAQATLGMSESIFRTPDAVARHYDALVESGRAMGVPDWALPKTEELYVPDAINLRKHANVVADEISKSQKILVENFDPFKALAAKSKKADTAFKQALDGDTEKLQDVLMDPVAWAGFIGNAAPSLYAALKSGGSPAFIAWMEGMEVSNDAADFEKQTGKKINDQEFARSQILVMGVNTWLEKLGLDKITNAKGLFGAVGAAITEGTTEGLQELTQNIAKKMGWRPEQSLAEGILPSIMGGSGTGVSVNVARQSVEAITNKQEKTQSDKLKKAQAAFQKLQEAVETESDLTNSVDELNSILADKETFDEVVQAFDEHEATTDAQKKADMEAGFAEINKGTVVPADIEPAAPTTEGKVAQSVQAEKAAREITGKPKSAMEAAFEKVAPKKYGLPIKEAVKQVDTKPTEAQKEAGNYRKGHTKVQGLDVAIENPKGSIRKGVDPGGQKWSQKMGAHYGYIKRTQGADGDSVDVFLGPTAETADTFYVVNQSNPDTGKFDEHKVMIGYPDQKAAKSAYMANYAKNWAGFDSIVPLSTEQFKRFLNSPKTKKALPESAAILLARTKATTAQQTVLNKMQDPANFNNEGWYTFKSSREKNVLLELQKKGLVERKDADHLWFKPKKEGVSDAKQKTARQKAKPAEKPAKQVTETGRTFTSPVPVSRLNAEPATDIYGKFGEVGKKKDTTENLTPYNLDKLVADPTQATDLAKKLGFEVKYFAFHKDEAAGVEFTSPKLKTQNYKNGYVWVYDPRVSDGTFKETEYVRQWRITHELGHALTENIMQKRYGDSRREGRLGQPLEVTRGDPAKKQAKVTIEPLTLKQAQRTIEWEDVAFRVQRMLLEELGVKTSPAEFANEYNINMADALHRVLTGKFTDPGKDGFVPRGTLPKMQSILKILENTENLMAIEQGRKPTKGINLEAYERVNAEKLQKIITKARKETPQLSRAGKKPGKLSAEYLSKVVKVIQKNWVNAPEMVVLKSAHELPSNIKEELIEEGSIDAAGAIYDPNTGIAYFFANKVGSKEEMLQFILHEIAGHHGLKAFLGEEANPLLREVYKANRKGIEERARTYGVPLTSDKARLNMANEYLASLAESEPESSFVTRVIAAIAQWIRKTFPSFRLTQAEIREVVVAMRKFVQTGERVQLAMNTVKQTQNSLRHTNDTDPTNFKKFGAFYRRNFTKEGLLPDEAFESKIKSDSLEKASEEDISFVVHKFEQAITKSLGVKNYIEVSEKKLAEINDYLHGNKDVAIPSDLKENLNGMRTYLDRLSVGMMKAINEMMQIRLSELSKKEQDAFKDHLNGDPAGYVPASLQKHYELHQTISKNLGTYMNRSYEAFDNKKWKNKVLKNKELIARAETFIEESNQDFTQDEVHGAVRAILQAAQDKGNFFSFLSGGTKYGTKNVNMLNQRKDVPKIIRELLGEYEDPRINFARSATNMYMYLANHEFLMQLRQKGMGTFLFERPIGEFDKRIAAKGSETMNPIDGLYTTPEFIQGLEDMRDSIEGGAVMRGFIRLNSAVKYGKTILAPTTQARNFLSAAFFSVMNGHFDWSHGSKAFKAARSDLFTKEESWRKYLNKMISLGVLHDNPRAEELRAAIEDFMSIDIYSKGPTKSLRRLLNFMQRLYQVGDDFWKIIGFENEFALQRKAGLSVKEAEEKAAYRIRNGYPTYSMVPRSIKLIRRWPLIGTFVSFPYEIVRTSYNQLGFLKEDIQKGNKAMAARRTLGMAMSTAVSASLSYMSMLMMGLDDDDDESIRNLAAPWMRNSQLVYLGYDENGYPKYVDFSYYDPYTYLKKPITAILNSNNVGLDKKIIDAGTEFLEPFIGVDIAAGALIEIYTNKRAGTGSKIYNESASVDAIATDMIDHFRKAAQPGVVSNAERMIKAMRGETSVSGKEYKIEDELVALVGFRMGTLNIPQSIYYKSLEFKDMKSLASQQLSKVVGSGQTVTEKEITTGFKGMIKAREKAYTDVIKVANAAVKLGVTKNELRKVLKASKVSDGDIRYILNDRIPPWRMSSSFLDSVEKRAMATADKEKRSTIRKELYDRKKFVYGLAGEQARDKK